MAASNPETAQHALTGSLPRPSVQCAALLTDGAAAYVETYGLADWATALDLLDPHGSQWPRYKRSDDATAALCLL